ncbi:MAG TPA: hypothetical protein VJP85_08245 [Candidatus Baltobacteraceae bacterium]|nr:hypothetical protein [Candidatus Baltobacteraceae bacterium]
MKQRALAAALAAAIGLGATAPALADGKASTRNIILMGTGAGILITNYNHKVREKRAQQQQVQRRQSAYRDWYYKKYGYYPTQDQFEQWYKQTYGESPQPH